MDMTPNAPRPTVRAFISGGLELVPQTYLARSLVNRPAHTKAVDNLYRLLITDDKS